MLRSIASTPSANRRNTKRTRQRPVEVDGRNRKRKTCRRGAGGAIARPAGSVLARADMGDETSQRGPFLLNYQRRRRCRQCGARAEPATQSQCCGEPGAVEGDPLARQRPVEVDAAVDRLHPVSESAKQKKKNLSARRRWRHRTPCWLRPRARGHG